MSEGVTTGLAVLMLVIGFAIAYLRYMTREALENAPALLHRESRALPAVLVHLYYVDEIIDAVIMRPARAVGEFFGRRFDPHVIDGVVREIVLTNRVCGGMVRAFQSGLVRAYALVLVFGAVAFTVYYALQGASR